jgi:hypothetical protein
LYYDVLILRILSLSKIVLHFIIPEWRLVWGFSIFLLREKLLLIPLPQLILCYGKQYVKNWSFLPDAVITQCERICLKNHVNSHPC